MGSVVSRGDIADAATRIEGHVRRTPVIELGDVFDRGFRVSLKAECFQPTGSFKVRGAFAALTATASSDREVVAASGGNFGLAVAYAAGRLGIRATIFVPATSPGDKVERIRRTGARVEVVPGYYADALDAAEDRIRATGAVSVHAYDQAEVVAGQGTVALEMSEQTSDASTILVAVGGGGLIAGIAKWYRGEIDVVGVEPESCPTLHGARRAGGPVRVEVGGVAASALGASLLGGLCWESNQWIGASVLVTDDEIGAAQRFLWETCRVVAEPAGATPVAALLTGRYTPKGGEHVVAMISGANTDPGSVTG